MTTRQEALSFGMTFKDVYQDTPFHDPNWILVRYKKNKKAFLWTYEYEGQMRINIKVDPQWRDFWREAYAAVIPGYHQNKEHWGLDLYLSIPVTAFAWCISICIQCLICKLKFDRKIVIEIAASFLFSMGAGLLLLKSGFIGLPMAGHFLERGNEHKH